MYQERQVFQRSNFRNNICKNAPRQKKRVQVGSTNMMKSASCTVLPVTSLKTITAGPWCAVKERPGSSQQEVYQKPLVSDTAFGIPVAASVEPSVEWIPDIDKKDASNIDTFSKTRHQLRHNGAEQFGSVRAMFCAFEPDASGLLSYDQFNRGLKKFGLKLSDEKQQLVYRWVDKCKSNAIDFSRFNTMFESTVMQSPFYDPDNAVRAMKYHEKLDLTPREAKRVALLRNQISKAISSQITDAGSQEPNSKFILHAFRRLDHNGDGFLTPQQLQDALGPDYLDTKLNSTEFQEILSIVDSRKVGGVSYNDFISTFVSNIEAEQPDMLERSRNLELQQLEAIVMAKMGPRPSTVPTMQQRNIVTTSLDKPSDHRIQRTLCARTVSTADGTTTRGKLREKRQQAKLEALDHDMMRGRSDRFFRKKEAVTDWTRVGFGGDGIDQSCALYTDENDRFLTTQQVCHSLGKSVSFGATERDVAARKKLTKARVETRRVMNEKNEKDSQHKRIVAEFDANARLVAKTTLKYSYLKTIHDKNEAETQALLLQKPARSPAFHRMWAGSLDSQFNSAPLT